MRARLLFTLAILTLVVGILVIPGVALATGTGTISGTITTSDGSSLDPSATVDLYSYDGTDWNWAGYASVASDGTYSATDLTPGVYRVHVGSWFGPNWQWSETWYDGADSLETATDVLVSADQVVSGVDMVITAPAHGNASISGTLSGVSSSGFVYAFVFNGEYWDLAGYADAAADGSYSVRDLSEGTYRLMAGGLDASGSWVSTYYEGATDLDTATDVPVGTDEAVTLDITIP